MDMSSTVLGFGTDVQRHCPYCGYVCTTTETEIRHMEREHPHVIEERLAKGGFIDELRVFREKRRGHA